MQFLKQRIYYQNRISDRILDIHGGALAGYSLKRLSKTQNSGANLRGADNSTLNAIFKGNKIDEYLISSFYGNQDVFVSSFIDQTGNGLTAAQSNAGKQGRISIAGTIQKQSEESVIDLIGPNLVEYQKTNQSLSNFTIYLRAKITNYYTALINQGSEPFPYLHFSNSQRWRSSGGIDIGGTGASYNYANFIWTRNGTNGKFYVNGTLIGETNSLSNSNTSFSHLLGQVFGNGMSGQFNTLIVYPVAHDASKVAAINILL